MPDSEIAERRLARDTDSHELLSLLSQEAFSIRLISAQHSQPENQRPGLSTQAKAGDNSRAKSGDGHQAKSGDGSQAKLSGGSQTKPGDAPQAKPGERAQAKPGEAAKQQPPAQEQSPQKFIPGNPTVKPDGSIVTKNAQGMPTYIQYATGERRQIEYFQDGKSIKAMWINGFTEWRKTQNTDEWYRALGDKVRGPVRRSFSFGKDDQLISENLEYKHHFKYISNTNGTAEMSIDGKREFRYDSSQRPFEIIDGQQKWKLVDRAKNEWKSKSGQIEHVAVEDGEYSFRDSQQYIHRFPLTGQQRRIKAADISRILKTGKISRQFEDTVSNAVGSLPQSIIDRLAAHGYKVSVDERTTTSFPDLKGVHPRGWPSTWTWDRADGLTRTASRIISISETSHNGTRFVHSRRGTGVAKHETGHAVDEVIGHSGRSFSSTPEFLKAYNQDVGKISARDKSLSDYTLQTGSPGREECFAEVFASIYGGPCNLEDKERIDREFPGVKAVIAKRIDDLEKQSQANKAKKAANR